MAKENRPKYLLVITRLLKMTGMYEPPSGDYAAGVFVLVANAVSLTVAVVLLAQFILNIYHRDADDEFANYVGDILNIGIYGGCGTRLAFGAARKRRITAFVASVNARLSHAFDNGERRLTMRPYARTSDRLAVVWVVFVVVSVQSVVFYPLVFVRDRRSLPLPAWTPWNDTVSPIFELSYLYQSFASFVLPLADITVTAFTISSALLLAGQFRLLGVSLENAHRAAAMNKGVPFERSLRAEYARCVAVHRNLLSCTRQFERLFAPINMVILSFDMFFIIFLAYTLVHTDGHNVTYVSYLIAALLEAFTVNYCGQIVRTESEKLRDSLYNAPWYRYGRSAKSTFRIMQLRMGVPVTLTAGKCVRLSFGTFLDIIRTSYSFYTVLSKMARSK